MMLVKRGPKEICIPFSEEMAEKTLQGLKYCTSRNRCYGMVGDWFPVGKGAVKGEYELIAVRRARLGYVADQLFRLEGFSSPIAFIATWTTLHPRKKYADEQMVWAHFYVPREQREQHG